MKKFIALALSLIMILGVTACGSSEPATDAANTTVSGESEASVGRSFVFRSGTAEIAMNAPAADIIAALGEPVSYFEEESCAFKGLDKTYTYANFVIYTYPRDDVDYISEVDLINDLASTAEGISIGDTAEMVEMAYGLPKLKGTSYSYTKGDCELMFILTDGKVSSIQYFADTGIK